MSSPEEAEPHVENEQVQAENQDPKQLARELLEAGELTILEIAAETGLSEPVVRGLKGVLVKASRKAEKEAGGSEGAPTSASADGDLVRDLRSEGTLASAGLTAARFKSRLKLQDPNLYRVLFPTEAAEQPGDGSMTRELINLEIMRYIKALRQDEEGHGHSSDGKLEALEQQLNSLAEENKELRETFHREQMQRLEDGQKTLQTEIQELRKAQEATDSTTQLIRTGEHLIERGVNFVENSPVRQYLVPTGVIKKPPSPQQPANPDARGAILEGLRAKGLTASVR